jgi:hypothetical protein
VSEEHLVAKQHIAWTEREILAPVVYIWYSYKPSVSRFPDSCELCGSQLPVSPRLAPNRAKPGIYIGLYSAHHEEVGGSADGPLSAPPFGAAAVAPPAGAIEVKVGVSRRDPKT